jgi:glycosyltransferase involved in cell wall biosynthesis
VALATQPDLRAGLGAAGRDHVVDQYTWERNASLMLDVYSGLAP